MKNCKECFEYACGFSGSDNISEYCNLNNNKKTNDIDFINDKINMVLSLVKKELDVKINYDDSFCKNYGESIFHIIYPSGFEINISLDKELIKKASISLLVNRIISEIEEEWLTVIRK